SSRSERRFLRQQAAARPHQRTNNPSSPQAQGFGVGRTDFALGRTRVLPAVVAMQLDPKQLRPNVPWFQRADRSFLPLLPDPIRLAQLRMVSESCTTSG